MIRKRLLCFGLAAVMAASSSLPAFAAVNTSLSSTSMENCGAYLFEWRPSCIHIGIDMIVLHNVHIKI